jgi:cell division septation protein DedD
MNYPSPFAEPTPSYESPQPGAGPSYQNSQYQASGYSAAPSYQAAEFGGQAYQQLRPSGFSGEHAGSQSYPASGYDSAQGFQGQSYREQSFADASFPESGASDASFPETSFDQSFADANFANQNFAKPGFADAGYAQHQGFDASFPEQVYPGAQPHGHQDQHAHDSYGQPEGESDQGYEAFGGDTAPDYGEQVPKMDPRRQLQAFDAIYDQPPQIALGSTEPTRRQAQDFYEGERLDADFLDEAQVLPPPGAPAKTGLTLKSRSAFMVGSALLGAIALGGALAFAYKQSGGGLSEPPPLVQADNSPVKEAPDQPGGKEFPYKNKLIYDRLENADAPEAERLVPRQEDVAVPALPGADPAAMPAPVASTDAAPPTTQALPGAAPIPVAAVDDPSMPDGGPRKVKTMVVRPDGSVETPPVPAAPTEAAPAEAAALAVPPAPAAADPQLAAAAPAAAQPQEAQAAPQEAAAPPAPEAKPKPAAKTAAATPQAAAGPTKYVVQVGSKKNQTEALASFADMQQKYPTLLASYRPIVQKADLGAKGTWYRLRIGPIADKTAANKLCSQLKTQGLPDCLVMGQ